jgi:hypothetical protein
MFRVQRAGIILSIYEISTRALAGWLKAPLPKKKTIKTNK